jgi:hypothetical protein
VFVKRIPLTDLELQHPMSTVNLFNMPTHCHYGVGYPSFNVWRELAAHKWSTEWDLTQQSDSFPLLYHWRVLDGVAPAAPAEDLVQAAQRGPAEVQARVQAMLGATASLVLYIEYVPYTLEAWLDIQLQHDAVQQAALFVEQRLRPAIDSMNTRNLFHFDAHLRNILTDGQRLYVTDFGLATSPRFDLSPAELAFVAANASHDRCHAVTRWVDWLVSHLTEHATWEPRNDFIAAVAHGGSTDPLPPWAATIVSRYAPMAAIVNSFYRTLHGEDPTATYPRDTLDAFH